MDRNAIINRLRVAGVPDPEVDARWLLAENKPERLAEWVERRCRREPLQYILGTTEFYGCRIAVDRRVLIPRPETEQVVETAIQVLSKILSPKILEIGTGSGCIAIALAKEIPNAQIIATDISPDALKVAEANAEHNGVTNQIKFVRTDLFPQSKKVDLIISNPPYIAEGELPKLMPEVRDWEPRLALEGGRTGLKVIKKITATAPIYLKPNGWLILEIGDDQERQVKILLEETERYRSLNITQDLAGRPRIAAAQTIDVG